MEGGMMTTKEIMTQHFEEKRRAEEAIQRLQSENAALRKQLDTLIDAVRRAKIIIEALFEKDDRDPCNNDGYCSICETLTVVEKEAK